MNVDEETRPGAGERNARETTTPTPNSNELKNQAFILEPTALEDAHVMHAMLGENDVQYSPIELSASENNCLWTGSGTQSVLQEGNWIPWNYDEVGTPIPITRNTASPRPASISHREATI